MKALKQTEFPCGRAPGGVRGGEGTKPEQHEPAGAYHDNVPPDNKKYRIRSGFILREIAGEYVIVPVDAGRGNLLENAILSPNGTAVFLWKCFEQPCTPQEAVIRGMAEYEVDEETIRSSVRRFVSEMLRYSILEEIH